MNRRRRETNQMRENPVKQRSDLGFRLARLLCLVLGHRWTVWVDWAPDNRRCERCLRWEQGHAPHRSDYEH